MICHNHDLLHSRVRRQITSVGERNRSSAGAASKLRLTGPAPPRPIDVGVIGADSRTVANHLVKTPEARSTERGVSRRGPGSPLVDKGRSLVRINATFRTLAPLPRGCDIKARGFAGQRSSAALTGVTRWVQRPRAIGQGRPVKYFWTNSEAGPGRSRCMAARREQPAIGVACDRIVAHGASGRDLRLDPRGGEGESLALRAPWFGSKAREITRVGFGRRKIEIAMFARAQSKTDQRFNQFDAGRDPLDNGNAQVPRDSPCQVGHTGASEHDGAASILLHSASTFLSDPSGRFRAWIFQVQNRQIDRSNLPAESGHAVRLR
jgi:hypothetical protein